MDVMKQDLVAILKERARRGEIDRRSMLKGMAMLGVSAAALRATPAMAAGEKVVVATWGGDGTDAIDKAFAVPFTQATGIEVQHDTSGPTEGTVRVQAQSGRVTLDVLDIDPFAVTNAAAEGMIRPIDYDIVDREKLRPGDDKEFYVPAFALGHVLVYDKTKFGDNPPRTWADFFDTEKFPGKRTFAKYMHGVLEAALLADGVAPVDLYPLDVDRALAKVETIMPEVAAVFASGAESQQLMLDRECSMGILWSSRAALVAKDDPDMEVYFPGSFLVPDTWAVMANNPAGNDAAMKFIASAQDPQQQVELFKLIFAGPVNPAADSLIPEDLKHLNVSDPSVADQMIQIDVDWYAANYSSALERFNATIAG